VIFQHSVVVYLNKINAAEHREFVVTVHVMEQGATNREIHGQTNDRTGRGWDHHP
jgi:hypothetical protein